MRPTSEEEVSFGLGRFMVHSQMCGLHPWSPSTQEEEEEEEENWEFLLHQSQSQSNNVSISLQQSS